MRLCGLLICGTSERHANFTAWPGLGHRHDDLATVAGRRGRERHSSTWKRTEFEPNTHHNQRVVSRQLSNAGSCLRSRHMALHDVAGALRRVRGWLPARRRAWSVGTTEVADARRLAD